MEQVAGGSEVIRIRGAARSSIGKHSPENEDAVGFFPELSLYAVADGVGGHAAGTVASTLSIEAIRRSLLESGDRDLTPVIGPTGQASLDGRRLLIALNDANDRVRDASLNDPNLRGMAAAVAAVLFDSRNGVVAISHVGDARVYRIRGDLIEQLTEDQTVVQQLVREGKISAEDIPSSPHRHMLTQAIGSDSIVRPGLRLEKTVLGDIFVLSSDGVHDVVEAEDIPKAVRQAGPDLEQACARLIEIANQRGRRDDATVLVLLCASESPAAAGVSDSC